MQGMQKIARRLRLGNDTVRQSHLKLTLQARKQLDTCQAVQPEICVEPSVEYEQVFRAPPALVQHAADNAQQTRIVVGGYAGRGFGYIDH
jgi:nucleotide-binding universal stress UspA family protein